MLTREKYESSFKKAGLSLLIAGYAPSMETFIKAAPLLGVASMLEMLILSAHGIPWPIVLIACLLSGVGFTFLPRLHKHVPTSAIQTQLLVFVLFPVLLSGLLAGWKSACIVAGINLLLLGIITAGSGYGLFAIFFWTLSNLLGQLKACVGLLSKAIPLLLIFALIIFINAELWETIGQITIGKLIAISILFLVLGAIFIIAHTPEELENISKRVGQKHPLNRPEKFNIILIFVVGQMFQAILVGAAVGLFFVVLGLLIIEPDTIAHWTGEDPNVLFQIPGLGPITEQILKVTSFLAAFTTLYFSVAILTDNTYSKEFGDQITEELQTVFSDRDEYLALIENDETV